MEEELKRAKTALDIYYELRKDETDAKQRQLVREYFDWVKMKTEIIANEKSFVMPEGILIQRGDVFWINFGYNIDEEFGGRHPGIVLRLGSRTAIVLPLSTKEPTQAQMDSGIYVEIKRVYNFKGMKRWVNVLNAMPVSIQRFDFSSKGNIKGWELDNITEAIEKSGIWKKGYKKSI